MSYPGEILFREVLMSYLHDLLDKIIKDNPSQPEFHQALREVFCSLEPTVERHPEFVTNGVYERIAEPDRQIIFRIPWMNEKGVVMVNRGYRVEFNNSIGPYKGGLRFHPALNLGIVKFLGFEQIFKNSLTTLPLGAGKGGADFDPKGKTEREIMSFCYSFMRELYRYLGSHRDVPAGDIGVGQREIGYMYGYYKKIRNNHTGVFTGKGICCGGSQIRREATGYGVIYFASEMLSSRGIGFDGKAVAVSGSGNVAQHAALKVSEMGGRVVTLSDSSGTVVDMDGIRGKKWDFIMTLKNVRRGRISEYAGEYNLPYFKGKSVWDVVKEEGLKIDIAFPCATQNEISGDQANSLVKNGLICLCEGANMPSREAAVKCFVENGILYGPGKAANAGGVAVSGLEMCQNAMRLSWEGGGGQQAESDNEEHTPEIS